MKNKMEKATSFFIGILCFTSVFCQTDCNTRFLGKYSFKKETDTLNVLLFKSKTCKVNNFSVGDAIKNNTTSYFQYNNSTEFYNCKNYFDSLNWIYFYLDENLFDTTKIFISKPYNVKIKKDKLLVYHCSFYISNKKWESDIYYKNGDIISLNLWVGNINEIFISYGYINKSD